MEVNRAWTVHDLSRRRSTGPDDGLPLRGLRPPARDSDVLREMRSARDTRHRRRSHVPRANHAGGRTCDRHRDSHRALHAVRSGSCALLLSRRATEARGVLPLLHGGRTRADELERPDHSWLGRCSIRMGGQCETVILRRVPLPVMRTRIARGAIRRTRSPHSIATMVSGRPTHSRSPIASRSRALRTRYAST